MGGAVTMSKRTGSGVTISSSGSQKSTSVSTFLQRSAGSARRSATAVASAAVFRQNGVTASASDDASSYDAAAATGGVGLCGGLSATYCQVSIPDGTTTANSSTLDDDDDDCDILSTSLVAKTGGNATTSDATTVTDAQNTVGGNSSVSLSRD